MNRWVTCTLSVIITGFLLAGSSLALDSSSGNKSTPQASGDRSAEGTNGHRARASELVLIGASVRTPEGENVGTVEDMILDMRTGEVEYVVLSKGGGSCGPGDKLFAVPAGEFKMKGPKQLEVQETKDKLDKAPSFERKSWARIGDSTWSNEIDSYYKPATAGRQEDAGEG